MAISITKQWWEKCLNDKEKLEHWLVGLYNNEKDAEERFINFAETYCKNDKEAYDTFIFIANQEKQHAALVDIILQKRGIEKYDKSSKDGRYWRNTLPCICDMQTAAAIGAYAEGLSLARMRVIIKDKNTPDDLKELFEVIEPEESYHAKALEKIATKYGMKNVKDCHDKGLEALGLKIKKVNMKGLYKLDIERRRSSNITGIFVEQSDYVDYLIKSKIEVHFGEIEGKHSDVYGSIDAKDISLITQDENVIKIVQEYGLENGINPFDYSALNEDSKYDNSCVREIIEDKLKK